MAREHGRRLRSQTDVGGILDGISAVLGALVVLTPFLCLETGNYPAAVSAFGCGFAVLGLAYLDGAEPESWTRWVSGVLGAWVAVSPWVLQRALVPVEAVLTPPMSQLAVSMPVVLGLAIVVTAAIDITRTGVGVRRSHSTARPAGPVYGVPSAAAFHSSTKRPIHPSEA